MEDQYEQIAATCGADLIQKKLIKGLILTLAMASDTLEEPTISKQMLFMAQAGTSPGKIIDRLNDTIDEVMIEQEARK